MNVYFYEEICKNAFSENILEKKQQFDHICEFRRFFIAVKFKFSTVGLFAGLHLNDLKLLFLCVKSFRRILKYR